ncbi:MAG: TIGR01777 family oxidoreductase [Longimicrobiales bacterium]
MRFVITGSSGLIGSALREELKRRGHEYTRVVRGRAGAGQVASDIARGTIDAAGLEEHDVAVHLAGEPIAGVWTAAKKRGILDSRINGTRLFARALAGLARPPHTLISMSGVNIYGSRPASEPVTEESATGDGFLAEVCVAWEAATVDAERAGIRVVRARTAPVLSPDGGALAIQLPIFRLGLGATFGSGEQPWPWIALEDLIHAQLFVAERKDLAGPVNFAAPGAVTNAEATKAIAAAVHRPAIFAIPAFIAKLAPGGMAEEILLDGARVVPARLQAAGYEFRHPRLAEALYSMLRGNDRR